MDPKDIWRSQDLIDAEEQEDRRNNEKIDRLKLIREAQDLSPGQKSRLKRTSSDRNSRLKSLLPPEDFAQLEANIKAVQAVKRASKSFDSSRIGVPTSALKALPTSKNVNMRRSSSTSLEASARKRKPDATTEAEQSAKSSKRSANASPSNSGLAVESTSSKRQRNARTPSPKPVSEAFILGSTAEEPGEQLYSRKAPRRSPRNKTTTMDIVQAPPPLQKASSSPQNVATLKNPTASANPSSCHKSGLKVASGQAGPDEVDSQATTASGCSEEGEQTFSSAPPIGTNQEHPIELDDDEEALIPPLKKRKSSKVDSKGGAAPVGGKDGHARGRRGRIAEVPPTMPQFQTMPCSRGEALSAPILSRVNTTGGRRSTKMAETQGKSAAPKKLKGKKKKLPQWRTSTVLEGLVLLYLPLAYRNIKDRLWRVGAAEANGAKAVYEFSPQVTHIIADETGMTFEQVRNNLGSLANPRDPPIGTPLVNQRFIPRCIEKKTVLNPREELGFEVPGYQTWLKAKDAEAKAQAKAAQAEIADAEAMYMAAEADTNSSQISVELPQVIEDSQTSSIAPPNDAELMPPPSSPASLQIKPDRHRQPSPGTPTKSQRAQQSRSTFEFEKYPALDWRDLWLKPGAKKKQLREERRDRARAEIEKESMHTPPVTPSKSIYDSEEEAFPSPSVRSAIASKESQSNGKALEQAIEEAKSSSKLSIDADDEFEHEDSQDRDFKRARRIANKATDPKSKSFACMQSVQTIGGKAEPNAAVIEKLQAMLEVYERRKDQWRTLSYRGAINALRKLTYRVTSIEQAKELPGVGESLALQIVEIVNENELKRLEYAQQDKDDQILQSFMQVYGAGLAQAQKWKVAGYRTLDDVRREAKLTANQQIGLDHYDDFLTSIPRSEVEVHEALVRGVLAEVSGDLNMTVMGSYRRGAPTCGDIDYLITPKESNMTNSTLHELIFNKLIPRLKTCGYLTAALVEPSADGKGSKWHGAAIVPGKFNEVWRRVDFLMVPCRELGAALLYFTGDDIFCRSIRLLASKKGMRLNQHGLYENVMRGPGREKLTEGTLVESRSESRIFEILGVPYKEPKDRIIR